MDEFFADADVETVFEHAVGAAERRRIAARGRGIAVAQRLNKGSGYGRVAPLVLVLDWDGAVPLFKKMIERVEIVAAEFSRVEAQRIFRISEPGAAIAWMVDAAAIKRIV